MIEIAEGPCVLRFGNKIIDLIPTRSEYTVVPRLLLGIGVI